MPSPTLHHSDSLDSTSLHARRHLDAHGVPDRLHLFIAATQTAGRGRFARPWASPRGGLWCTALWPGHPAPGLSLAAALAVVSTLHAAAPALPLTVKWPNDVLCRGRKIAGILTEAVVHAGRPAVLLGIGINADFPPDQLPPDLRPRATTLRAEAPDAPASPDLLLPLLAAALPNLADPAHCAAAIPLARPLLDGMGQPRSISLPDGSTLRGTIFGLRDDGALLLTLADGSPRAITAGEVGDAVTP